MEEPPCPLPAPPADDREPFWTYTDLALLVGIGVPGMLIAAAAAGFVMSRLTALKAVQLVPAQFVGYAVPFLLIWLMFRVQYERPFWDSLDWKPMRMPAAQVVFCGVAAALAVSLGAGLMHMPNVKNPMMELLTDRVSVLVVAAFGVTLGPLCEELLFRGFLQPLLVRTAGVVAGICLTAVPFGLLHLQQYGYSWRHALLITIAGVGFGWMRQVTGSTRASTLMHAAYNGLFFVALLAQRKELPNLW
jgi:uncharacterized protein